MRSVDGFTTFAFCFLFLWIVNGDNGVFVKSGLKVVNFFGRYLLSLFGLHTIMDYANVAY
jgi:hypothetical protein